MAMTKTILRKSATDVIVRFIATSPNDEGTITVAECLDTNETKEATVQLNLHRAACFVAHDQSVDVVRNSVIVAKFYGIAELDNNWVISDQGNEDFTVTFGAAGMLILHIKKVSGFNSPHETAIYGSYDDPTAVGS
jgi:hypothetical protein